MDRSLIQIAAPRRTVPSEEEDRAAEYPDLVTRDCSGTTATYWELSLSVRSDNVVTPNTADEVNDLAEQEWILRLKKMETVVAEKEAYAAECAKALETEKQLRARLEEANKAMHAFVRDIDLYITGKTTESRISKPRPSGSGALAALNTNKPGDLHRSSPLEFDKKASPVLKRIRGQPSLLEQMPEELEMLMNQDDDFDAVADTMASLKSSKTGMDDKENIAC